jgi:hypothetical protein
MSKKSKAYQAAAEHMAAGQPTLTPEDLEAYHHSTWDIIWKAARRAEWEKCQDDDLEPLQAQITKLMLANERLQNSNDRLVNNQLSLAETAKKRLEEIRRLEDAQSKLETAQTDIDNLTEMAQKRLEYAQRAQRRSIELLRSNQTLRSQNESLKQQLVKATALTTEGTRTLQERYDKLLEEHKLVERLYDQINNENDYHENALLLDEEELVRLREQLAQERTRQAIASKKPEGDGWQLTWTRMTGQTITGTVTTNVSATENVTTRALTRPCTGRRGEHRCVNQAPVNKVHSSEHRCHCGTTWR